MMLNLAGYQEINLIYAGSRTLVYRAVQTGDRKPVIIKVLRNPHPNFKELVQFRNQYVITRHLEHPTIVRPLALKRYGNGYALVMPDDGDRALWDYWQESDRSITEFLTIAMQLADALHYLGQQRIIHKDIKPTNILIHPETGDLKLIDFSISSLLPKEQQQLINPNVLEGTLTYISPEQTGRMNRGIDYRTDFYSLGVTFFELLTGKLPFTTSDLMELVHCHIAQELQFPCDSEVPQVVQDLVVKLMAKNAEERYQSALGLKQDLELCLQQLEATGEITSFALGQLDRCDRFIIPEKLYGREAEVLSLLDAFDRVANGATEMMLVAGFSGIGKTAVINEVHKPIARQRGYFIKGKFDQFNRNIPFSAFVEAFRDLMGQLLGSSDAELAAWKAKIISAVGENGQVIIDVIPELEPILGKQPAVPELDGSAAQNRFNLLFGKFVRVFTTKEHPLVIFLDDLQWADLASLNLLKLLMNSDEAGYLLVLGAYRDNEVFPAHPLMLTLDEILKQGARGNTLTLAPLGESDITRLIADTLLCSVEIAGPLSQLIYQKTKGNPFFTTQFLKGLHEEGCITFSGEDLYWQCDLTQVRQLALTEDVVAFMVGRLTLLPEATQDVLKLAACIGNRFDLGTLAVVCDRSLDEVAASLWRGLQEGFVVPETETYKFFQGDDRDAKTVEEVAVSYRFLHDRVQQAAYSMIPDEQKETTHYHIGELLLQKIPREAREDRIFEIVSQLNYGTALITEQTERDELAQLNLIACRKARAATAYQAGREYARTGLSLLQKKAWQRQYEMSLDFHDLAAELASLCGDFEAMEQFGATVIARASNLLDMANIYRTRIQAKFAQNQLNEAIDIAQQFLKQLGVTFPQTPTENDAQQLVTEIENLIGDRKIEDLVYLPIMIDGEKIAILQTVASIIPAAYNAGSSLFSLLVSLAVKLSIEYGNTSASTFAYATYGIVACNLLQDVNTGVKFGQLALQTVRKLDAKTFKPQVLQIVAGFTHHRKSHMKGTLPLLQEAYTSGIEVGNQEYAGHSGAVFCLNSFWCGQPLEILEQETRSYYNGLMQLNQLTTANYCRFHWQTIFRLLGVADRGNTERGQEHCIGSGEALQETEMLALLTSAHDLYGLYIFYLHKLIICYLLGEIESARQYAVEIRPYLIGGTGTVGVAGFYFYDSSIVLATCSPESEEISEIIQQVDKNQKELQKWAQYAPMNHQHKVDLVSAEKCRVLGQKLEAIELYDRAIAGAKANEYMQEEALANELAAKFYLDWGKEKIAATYMQEAYYCYARWGAKAKTDQLCEKYPQLLGPIFQKAEPRSIPTELLTSTQTLGTVTSTISVLDLASAIKASQAISEEIELEALLSKLMGIAIENAGADKGALVLDSSGNWEIAAICAHGTCHLETMPTNQTDSLPISIINTVKRRRQTIAIDNISQDNRFTGDPYLNEDPPRSLCCTPIINQGKLIGILYLENNLTAGAFSKDRIEVLNLLSAQAAISISNARLYSRLEDYSHNLEAVVSQRTEELQKKNQHLQQTLGQLQQTQAQLIQAERMSGLGQMVAGIAHEINNPITFIAGNIGHAKEYFQDLLDLLYLYEQNWTDPSEAILDKLEEIDLDYLRDDLEKMFGSMSYGSSRIREIVLNLRNFSRLDESQMKSVDIHEGLENTLMILQHRLKASGDRPEIILVKNYAQLPLINCYASQLNQVFMHIITNAIDALINYGDRPNISITTEMISSQKVRICIADNGPGIPESDLGRIFDPFFTTKPVGQGTGLGLSISYQIITEQHGGQLHCISHPGLGTSFAIDLPIGM